MDIRRLARGRRFKLSPEQIEELLEYYNDGLKLKDIAERLGVSLSTITRTMRILRDHEESSQ